MVIIRTIMLIILILSIISILTSLFAMIWTNDISFWIRIICTSILSAVVSNFLKNLFDK